jgi:hypothetical protein
VKHLISCIKKSEEIVTMAEDEANKIIKKLKGIKVIK